MPQTHLHSEYLLFSLVCSLRKKTHYVSPSNILYICEYVLEICAAMVYSKWYRTNIKYHKHFFAGCLVSRFNYMWVFSAILPDGRVQQCSSASVCLSYLVEVLHNPLQKNGHCKGGVVSVLWVECWYVSICSATNHSCLRPVSLNGIQWKQYGDLALFEQPGKTQAHTIFETVRKVKTEGLSSGKVKRLECSKYSVNLNWYIFLARPFFRWLKYNFTVGPVYSRTLLSFHAMHSGCLSKLGACRPPSTVGKTLTMDKYLIQPHFKKSEIPFKEG